MNGARAGDDDARRSLHAVERRLSDACRAAGRARESVRLLAVSKTFDALRVLALARAGQQAFGENYLGEALDKQARCRDLAPEIPLQWHFIGPVQSNKTRAIAERFDWVHSVDRERIARRLGEQRPKQRGPLDICIQVNVDDESTKSGCAPEQLPELAAVIARIPGLRLRGLMAIPAPAISQAAQRAPFARLRAMLESLRADGHRLDTLSMGMSADLESAIAEGATIVRVGTALFGQRRTVPPGSDTIDQPGAGPGT